MMKIYPTNKVLIQDRLNFFRQRLKGLSKTDDFIEKKEKIQLQFKDFQDLQASLCPF